MFLNPRAVESAPETIIPKIEKEKSSIAALFLESSAIESYLSSFISLTGKKMSKGTHTPHNGVEESIKKMGFNQLLSITNDLGVINDNLYKKLNNFAERRNQIAHNLIGIDLDAIENTNEIKSLVSIGLELCKSLSKLHTEMLYSLTEK